MPVLPALIAPSCPARRDPRPSRFLSRIARVILPRRAPREPGEASGARRLTIGSSFDPTKRGALRGEERWPWPTPAILLQGETSAGRRDWRRRYRNLPPRLV